MFRLIILSLVIILAVTFVPSGSNAADTDGLMSFLGPNQSVQPTLCRIAALAYPEARNDGLMTKVVW